MWLCLASETSWPLVSCHFIRASLRDFEGQLVYNVNQPTHCHWIKAFCKITSLFIKWLLPRYYAQFFIMHYVFITYTYFGVLGFWGIYPPWPRIKVFACSVSFLVPVPACCPFFEPVPECKKIIVFPHRILFCNSTGWKHELEKFAEFYRFGFVVETAFPAGCLGLWYTDRHILVF